MDQTIYHVLLEGRTVGPYDRRTIVGMRIKKALTSDHVLIGTDGGQLTVADLIHQPRPASFNPERSGSFSVVQARFSASVLQVEGRGLDIPRFKGEIEVRVQNNVLRLAGRFRQGLGLKEGRVKIPIKDVVHARVTGSQVELGLRCDPAKKLQRVALELFTPESAMELAQWLPAATPFTEPAPLGPDLVAPRGPSAHSLYIALAGVALVIGLMLLLYRRVY
ncbi:hypothetical protein [Caenimonas soli]|uniref:hypothetical protein n=1 Tax=Caenimonas soli TaxID=2735555 RepID=UPI001552F08A|nr:hypothetical protein [Caenimonas soli]NPC56647.1 hypothetical protein [Caenimonas soli]